MGEIGFLDCRGVTSYLGFFDIGVTEEGKGLLNVLSDFLVLPKAVWIKVLPAINVFIRRVEMS